MAHQIVSDFQTPQELQVNWKSISQKLYVLAGVFILKIDIINRNLKKFKLDSRSELKHAKFYRMAITVEHLCYSIENKVF